MSMHKKPLTRLEEEGLRAHGLPIGTPSQLSDVFRHGIAWAASQNQSEVQRLRVALEHCLDVMKDPWKHGEGCISRAIYMADTALAASTGQEG